MTNEHLIEDLTLVPIPAWWQSPWVWIALVLLVGAAVALFMMWWRARPQPTPVVPIPPPGPPAHLDALRRLAELRARQGQMTPYAVAVECSDILRLYIEGRFALPIRYQTTREFLGAAQTHPQLGPEPRHELGEFLGFFDQLKFAQGTAEGSQMLEVINGAERFIRRCIPPETGSATSP